MKVASATKTTTVCAGSGVIGEVVTVPVFWARIEPLARWVGEVAGGDVVGGGVVTARAANGWTRKRARNAIESAAAELQPL